MHVQTQTRFLRLPARTDLLLLEGLESFLETGGEHKVTPPGQEGQLPSQVGIPS